VSKTPSPKKQITLFWFRRDLRLNDNKGLYEALNNNHSVLPLFIFDTGILDKLPNKEDRRVCFILQALANMQEELVKMGSSLLVLKGDPLDIFKELCGEYSISAVYTNQDYEPAAIARDSAISGFLMSQNIPFLSFKDQVIFEKAEVTKADGAPYTIFTPYSKAWKQKWKEEKIGSFSISKLQKNFLRTGPLPLPSLREIGFAEMKIHDPVPVVNKEIILHYDETRNFPAVDGTTHLSVHLRFGTISIRKLAGIAADLNEQWLNELIWREFFMMILYHFPQVVNESFKKKYDLIAWRNQEGEFLKWCEGKTGYPIVDAGMRELNETGFMHNRVRMIVASFLTKHLLIDWRWGEAYFAEKLLDYELSSNNGNWQWAAGCGCDAAPYFRIFNPYEQVKKFDPQLLYIKKWVKDLDDFSYPPPMVDHKFARERVLRVYKEALDPNS
jgi:deoxyribodipyrimidine photo-lyase